MELKSYQSAVMRDLTSYLTILNRTNDLKKAWREYWAERDIAIGIGGVPAYNNALAGVPHVCMKVPTGGGKTFMGCSAIRRIFDELPPEKSKVVVWLVPSDPILVQTVRTLSDTDHPYRRKINSDFGGRVGVYTKEMLLNGQNFSPDTVREQLTVCILSYGSLRIDSKKKDVRKVYQENGNLLRFAEYFKDESVLLADTPDTALIQVLRSLSPIVIVDESHNAGSELSIEMLNNLNPSFVLDLTATPRKNSNIISYVEARELKKENMVKLPVIVYNKVSQQSVIKDAIQLRSVLENVAISEEKNGGKYIRPIVLFQAQPKTNNDSETFEKVKNKLIIEEGIPKEQIAIKTSNVDDLKNINLMSRDCPILYIITVNALKEGWDCPFAYILASLANKTSKVDVEQILGRVLRLPYASKHNSELLNMSYVITCSNDFHDTLENIVKGLNSAGFSRKDFRTGEDEFMQWQPYSDPQPYSVPNEQENNQEQETETAMNNDDTDNFADITASAVVTAGDFSITPQISNMINQAKVQSQIYDEEAEESERSGHIGGELGTMMKQYHIQPQYREQIKNLRIPQFFIKSTPDLFGEDTVFLEKEHLLSDFRLNEQNAEINFTLSAGEIYSIDVQDQGDSLPKYKRVSKSENEYMRQMLSSLAPKEKTEKCVKLLCHEINRNNAFATSEIEEYIHRIVKNMSEDEISGIETSLIPYAQTIKKKIEELQKSYSENIFYKWLDSGKIICKGNYKFPEVITPSNANSSVPFSLYEAEYEDLNEQERDIRDVFASSPNIEWWHRVMKKGFKINAFINHYPDFIVKLKSGKILAVEYKGDDRDNSNSKFKLTLGKTWAAQAGAMYRYFMVFRDNPLEGAYKLVEFAEMLNDM